MSYQEIKNIVDDEVLGNDEVWKQFKQTPLTIGVYKLLSEENNETNAKILMNDKTFSKYYLEKYRDKYNDDAKMEELVNNIDKLSFTEVTTESLKDARFDIYESLFNWYNQNYYDVLLNAVSRVVISYYAGLDATKMKILDEKHDFLKKYNRWIGEDYNSIRDLIDNGNLSMVCIFMSIYMTNECYESFEHESEDIIKNINRIKRFVKGYKG